MQSYERHVGQRPPSSPPKFSTASQIEPIGHMESPAEVEGFLSAIHRQMCEASSRAHLTAEDLEILVMRVFGSFPTPVHESPPDPDCERTAIAQAFASLVQNMDRIAACLRRLREL